MRKLTLNLIIVGIFVDGANPSIIRALKEKVDGDPNYEKQIDPWYRL